MKNFTYHSQEEKENLEAILRRRQRKFNRQQISAAIITAVLLGMLGLYFAFHMYYTEYDGYIHVDANEVRTPFDIYLDSVYVHEGDILAPGDTLYSYFNIDQLVEHFNINTEPAVISRHRDLTVQMASLQQQVAVLRARIRELQAQIEVEDHNISFGLSSNSHKLDLQRELNVARVQLQALLQQLGVVSGLRNQTNPQAGRSASINGGLYSSNRSMIYDDASSALLYETKSYHLASDSSIVTDIMAPDRMVFFKKEAIMTTQHLDLEANNLKVVAYIPIDAMHRITRQSTAEVVVNSDFSFDAHVSVLGLRTEVIPDNLRSYFSRRNTAVIALLTIDEGQMVPFWTMADGIPVSVRVRNIDTWGEKPSARNYLWYKTGEGLQTQLPDDWVYTTKTARDTVARPPETEPDTVATQQSATESVASAAGVQTSPAAPVIADTTTVPVRTASADGRYFIIAAALNTEAGARKTLQHYQGEYPAAGIILNGPKWLVYLERHTTRPEAETRLIQMRRSPSLTGAWIYEE